MNPIQKGQFHFGEWGAEIVHNYFNS